MTPEDEEFNRIERESDMRRKALRATIAEHNAQMLKSLSDYERGVICDMQKQAQSSVDKAVNAMVTPRKWVGLTDEEISELHYEIKVRFMGVYKTEDIYRAIEAKLREKNT